jgi:hypothetical protein
MPPVFARDFKSCSGKWRARERLVLFHDLRLKRFAEKASNKN